MLSMTGYGKAVVEAKPGKFTVEISSVNNRFLEISLRLPRRFYSFEPNLRKLIGEVVQRGKINFFLGFEESDDSPGKYQLNATAARAYTKQLRKLKKELKLEGEISVRDLVALPDLAESDEDAHDEKLMWPPLEQAARKALHGLIAMRQKEGKAMARNMSGGLKVIDKQVGQITAKSHGAVDKYREKLTLRIDELMQKQVPDRLRLEEEIAIFAERTDIAEEIARLQSHIQQFKDAIAADGPVGKRLNFILQEMNREANTIGSKSAEIEVTGSAISLKEEIERLREMIQNVE